MFREWLYLKDGREWGPLTREELHELVEEGHVEPNILVKRADLLDWLPLNDVMDLEDAAPPVPVLPAEGPIPVGYARPLPDNPNLKYASFSIRVAAFLIDFLLLALVANGGEFIGRTLGIGSRTLDDIAGVGLLLGVWLYYALSESSSRQGTLGKQSFGLRVVDVHGRRLSFGRATGRFFGKYLSALPIYAGFFAIAFTEKKQGFHDQMAGTYVVRS